MAREFLRITKEATWGVFDNTATGADVAVIDLSQDNAFTMRSTPRSWTIRSAAGIAGRRLYGSAQAAVTGRLSCLFYTSQQALLIPWGMSPSGSPLDLYSCTIDHAILLEGGTTVVRRRYPGVKVDGITIEGDAGSADANLVKLVFDLIGKQVATTDPDATAFPEPLVTDYPTDPYVFQMSSGALKVGGIRSEYDRFRLSVDNLLHAPYYASSSVGRIAWKGRNVDFSTRVLLSSNADRLAYEALTAQDSELTLTNGTKSAKFDFHAKLYFVDPPQDDLPLNSGYYQTLSGQVFLDTAQGTDLTVTLDNT